MLTRELELRTLKEGIVNIDRERRKKEIFDHIESIVTDKQLVDATDEITIMDIYERMHYEVKVTEEKKCLLKQYAVIIRIVEGGREYFLVDDLNNNMFIMNFSNEYKSKSHIPMVYFDYASHEFEEHFQKIAEDIFRDAYEWRDDAEFEIKSLIDMNRHILTCSYTDEYRACMKDNTFQVRYTYFYRDPSSNESILSYLKTLKKFITDKELNTDYD